MDIYKASIKNKVRYNSSKGLITTEQLWDLNLTDLDDLAVTLSSEYEDSDKKTFIKKKNTKNELVKLKLDVVVDVIDTKMAEAEDAKQTVEKKANNEKIMALIKEKEEDSLKDLSVDELKDLLQ